MHDREKSTYFCSSSWGQDVPKPYVVCGVLLKHLKQSLSGKAEQEQTLGNKNTLQHWHLLVTSVPNCDNILTVLHFSEDTRVQPKLIHLRLHVWDSWIWRTKCRRKSEDLMPILSGSTYPYLLISMCSWCLKTVLTNKYTPARIACLETVSWDPHVRRKQCILQSPERLGIN